MPHLPTSGALPNLKGAAKRIQNFVGDVGALNTSSHVPNSKAPEDATLAGKRTLVTSPPARTFLQTGDRSSGAITEEDVVLDQKFKPEVEIEVQHPLSHTTVDDHPKAVFPTLGEDKTPRALFDDPAEEELSEGQLRKLFEDEEIERFIEHFNTHVHEVCLPLPNPPSATDFGKSVSVHGGLQGDPIFLTTDHSPTELETFGSAEDGAWSMVDKSYATEGAQATDPQPSPDSSTLTLSEEIARKLILPHLPPRQPTSERRFTIGRARLQVERFNLVTQPVYGPFFSRLWGYASWRDRGKSARYCTIFWVLWIFNLLLPALISIILYTLFSRRIFPYPTLEQLRARRHEAARAEALGEEVEKRLATGPNFGLRDTWSLFRSIIRGKRTGQNKNRKPAKSQEVTTEINDDTAEIQVHSAEGRTAANFDVQEESQAEKDIKQAIIQAMMEISDLHERIKNIFLWRRPMASRTYAIGLLFLFLVSLLLPANHLAKLAYLVGGFSFWFIPPIILGLETADRARIPPAFADSPTDAQYAMELIALRVARGEHVVPVRPKSAKKTALKSTPIDAGPPLQDQAADKEGKREEIDWRKWGERAARSFAWAEEGKNVLKGDMASFRKRTWPQAKPPIYASQEYAEAEVATYPAQHTSGPGLLMLTSTAVSFTQVLSSKPKVEIALNNVRGIKKTGKMGGLTLKWGETAEEEKEEKFTWIGGRDEIFAKLVGWRGRRWVHM